MAKATIGRCILGILALFFMGTGLVLMISPSVMLTHTFIEPIDSVSGLSSIRSLWGGTTIAIWAMVLLGAIRSNVDYIMVGFIALMLVLFGRLVGYFIDGSYPELIPTVAPTIVATVIMIIACKLMAHTKDA
ncbi:DUF4345 family protein [Microbulbifer sp. ZKSA002]|uniref:DUF4345 family protein n=1 Tax=Microbulbifer sp. ZKSA002 TaxID=3243388 RepID=UPI00403A13CF